MAGSKYGLTPCGVCGVEIRLGEPCPFCLGRRPGRGSLVAAGLLSVGLATACDDEDPDPDPTQDAQAVDGGAADAQADMSSPSDMSPPGDAELLDAQRADVPIVPPYGVPPDASPPPQDMSPPAPDMNPEPDLGVAPLYGIPPMDAAVPEPDMGLPLPPYGIPPQEDAAPPPAEDAGPMIADGEVAVPLYGIPPGRE